MNILDKLKEELGDIAEEQLDKVKVDLSDKIDDVFDDELQKEIVDALNKSIDVPFINEDMEEKGLNFLYDLVEEKVKAIPQQMSLNLPKLKKVGDNSPLPLKLPKLKKVEA